MAPIIRKTDLPQELQTLKIIAVEEHTLASPTLNAKFPSSDPTIALAQHHAKSVLEYPDFNSYSLPRLAGPDATRQRTTDMENDLISLQILSRAASVNTGTMEPLAAAALCGELNDELRAQRDVDARRFAALAELPFQAPELAFLELKRCIQDLGFVGVMLHGHVGGKFLDDARFDSVLSAIEDLDVPLYLHPGIPPKAVVDAYYTIPGNDGLTAMLSSAGWGWHSEVAIHVLRLAVSGTLDRHPRLKIVVGHQGEMMPMMMERFGQMFEPQAFGLKRTVPEMLKEQVWIAISGMFSVPVTQLSIKQWGVERVLFAVDYPMVSSEAVPGFIKGLSEVMELEDIRRICLTNSEELFKVKAQ